MMTEELLNQTIFREGEAPAEPSLVPVFAPSAGRVELLPSVSETDSTIQVRPYLSLAVLAYNERDTVARMVRLCSEILSDCGHTYELVLVDDGSTDGTREVVLELAAELPHCRSVLHPRNLGIGEGIRTCYFRTTGEWATWFPADMQADPRELPRLLQLLPGCDVLVTYREARLRQEGWRRKLISRVDRALVRLLFGVGLNDLHWVRFFRRSVLDRLVLTSRSPFIDTEMVVGARRLGARIRQTPLQDQPRRFGTAKGATLKNLVSSVADLFSLYQNGVHLAPNGGRS
jgi:glycosyltransferase involved in cell wall biosynthesis